MKPKRYKCKYCKEFYFMTPSEKSQMSLGWLNRCCKSDTCIDEAYEVYKDKLAKQKLKEWKKRKDQLKHDIGVKKKPHEEPLQKACNKIAKLLDKDLPCIARPIENHNFFDGGHVYSVGSHPALRYNLNNIFKQSVKSNRDLGGEQSLMLEGIEILHGIEQREKTEGLVQKYPILKLTYDEKKQALKEANKIVRELKEGKQYTRDQVNKKIGIYE